MPSHVCLERILIIISVMAMLVIIVFLARLPHALSCIHGIRRPEPCFLFAGLLNEPANG